MEQALTKYFWIINLITLIAIAYLVAGGAGELVATKVSAAFPSSQGKRKAAKAPRPFRSKITSATRDGSDILKRNIFDSIVGPIDPNAVDGEIIPEDLPPSLDGLPIVPCPKSQVTLTATVAAPEAPEWSFASISEGGQGRLCRIGDQVDGRTVSRIFWRYLFLRGTTDECYMTLFDDGKALPTMRPPMQARRAGPGTDDEIKNGIQSISETEKVVDRSLIDKLVANPSRFIRSVRVRPFRQDGKVVGFKLRRFKGDSPLALLGAKKGDIIHSVNGVELTSVDKALGAYQNLRSSNALTFSITRNGKPLDLNINIR